MPEKDKSENLPPFCWTLTPLYLLSMKPRMVEEMFAAEAKFVKGYKYNFPDLTSGY